MSSLSPSQRSNARLGIYFAAASALTLGLSVGVFELFRAQQPEATSEVPHGDAEGLSEQVHNLSREVRLLRARQAGMEETAASFETLGPRHDDDRASEDSSARHEEEMDSPPPELTPEESEARAVARYEFLDLSLQTERRDPDWSTSTEGVIAGVFQSEALNGARLDSASCGSTMCKVEVSLQSESELDGFQEEFARVLRDSLPRGTMRPVETENGELKMVAYLARPDSRLPHWEPEESNVP